MRASLTAVILLLAPFVRAEEDERRYEVVHCGKDTAVLYPGSESPDKHYALGWTIRPVTDDALPVDWARLEKEGWEYLSGFQFGDGKGDPDSNHKVTIGLIDQHTKSFKSITDTFPPMVAHWDDRLEVRWIDKQHAFAQNEAKWGTYDLFFLRASSDSFEAIHPLSEMRKRVRELLGQKRPLAPHMLVDFDFSEEVTKKSPDTTIPKTVPCKVENGILHMYFSAYIPRGINYEDLTGHVLISLKDGKPIKAVSDDPADKPFVGELGEADQRLNEIYAKLSSRLTGDELKEFKTNEAEWIERRNNTANQKSPDVTEDCTLETYRKIRNEEALKLTRERTEVLQKQLVAIESK